MKLKMKSLGSYFTQRDFLIVTGFTSIIGLSVLAYLMQTEAAIENTQFISKVFSVIVLLIIGANLTYFIFAFMRYPAPILKLLQTMTTDGSAFRLLRDITALNLLCVFNYTILTLCNFIDVPIIQAVLISLTIGLWPVALLIILSIDTYLDKKRKGLSFSEEYEDSEVKSMLEQLEAKSQPRNQKQSSTFGERDAEGIFNVK